MRLRTRIGIVLSVGVVVMAEADGLGLDALKRPDLIEQTISLSELRRTKRSVVRLEQFTNDLSYDLFVELERATPFQPWREGFQPFPPYNFAEAFQSLNALSRMSADSEAELLVKFRTEKEARTLTVNAGESAKALHLLRARGDVEYAEPNTRVTRQFVPSDPRVGSQWHHDTLGSYDAWEWGLGSPTVKVAIIDAPFNLAHPDLAAHSTNGWDVVNEVPVFSGTDYHSSISAGLVGAGVDNGIGVAGMGNFTLIPVNNAYVDLSSDVAQMDAAIRWAASNGVRVVNLSWDGADSAVLNDAAQFLRETTDGIVVMAGVNGTGVLNYTNQPYIVAVSMTDQSDNLRSTSGPHIDFAAPGYNVYSTGATSYETGSGSSYAAPVVVGLFAALFSINPSLSAEDAIEIVKATAKDLGEPGWDPEFGWGRVDFKKAAWLAAVSAGAVTDLGIQMIEPQGAQLLISTEFHRGMNYQLLQTTNLNAAVWTMVSSPMQTNDVNIGFWVTPTAEQSFYKMQAQPGFLSF
ncbi:MAG: S8 family serine peptidase [Pontiellaceae bacterium]|nr:S8 family serine peptidase [Pontiellaceae bacterium]